MKTMLSLILVFFIGTVQAQKVINLDPATVTYTPNVMTSSNLDNLEFEVVEDFSNQFINNPIKFIQTNFDFNSLGLVNFELAEVSFITKKGYLKATYDNKGELVRTYQRFRQIALPREVWEDIYRQNEGWLQVSNQYTATGKGNMIDKELYRIKLRNGDEIKKIKYVPKSSSTGRVASN